ncbi:MAG: transposase [Steroidobacteraceae bacterium]
MVRYSDEFKERAVARLLPPEGAKISGLSQERGVSVATFERWRESATTALARPEEARASLRTGGGSRS